MNGSLVLSLERSSVGGTGSSNNPQTTISPTMTPGVQQMTVAAVGGQPVINQQPLKCSSRDYGTGGVGGNIVVQRRTSGTSGNV